MERPKIIGSERRRRAEQTSQAIFEFLCRYTNPPVTNDDYSVSLAASFSSNQLKVSRPMFERNNVSIPDAVRLARVLPAPKDERSKSLVLSRGFTYVSLEYPETVVVFGGVLGAHGQEATHIWKRIAAVNPPVSETEAPAELSWHYPKQYAEQLRLLGANVLSSLALRRPEHQMLDPGEAELLIELCAIRGD